MLEPKDDLRHQLRPGVGGRDFDDRAVRGLWLRHTDLLRTAEFGVDIEGASLRAHRAGWPGGGTLFGGLCSA
jgi:hypothetical protein